MKITVILTRSNCNATTYRLDVGSLAISTIKICYKGILTSNTPYTPGISTTKHFITLMNYKFFLLTIPMELIPAAMLA